MLGKRRWETGFEAEDGCCFCRLCFAWLMLLDACCAEPLFPKIEGIHTKPGAPPST